MNEVLSAISGFVWGPPTIVLIVGTGLYLMIRLKFMPVRRLLPALGALWRGRHPGKTAGEITPFQALMTSLSGTIGTGNIVGVATAIGIGGPGAVFWMWVTALVGMATKYAEAVLAVNFRERHDKGHWVGGPMYYIKNGLSKRWRWLGALFAVFAMCAAFGIGNMVQAHSVADALHDSIGVPVWATGLVLAGIIFAVIIGGIKRIAKVAEKLVPFMAIVYVLGAAVIIALHIETVPSTFALIFKAAFTPTAATGGFLGAGIALALQMGVARGVFSNEAGLGSAPIAHASAQVEHPADQGIIAMLGPFFDTIVVCTMTALVIIGTGAWSTGEEGAVLSATAFQMGLPGTGGQLIVSFGLIVFAFTTMLAWAYYGETSAAYLFGDKVALPYRYLWVIAVFTGAMTELGTVWTFADIMNALMAVPNLIALLLLSGLVVKLARREVG